MSGLLFTLRPYAPADEDAAIELWRRTWQLHYPQIDFDRAASSGGASAGATSWCRSATITVAEADGELVGFVTVDPKTLDLDQIVVAPEAWGSGVAAALIAEAKRLSPDGLDLQSTPTMRAPSASTRSRASSSPAKTSTRARARRSTR